MRYHSRKTDCINNLSVLNEKLKSERDELRRRLETGISGNIHADEYGMMLWLRVGDQRWRLGFCTMTAEELLLFGLKPGQSCGVRLVREVTHG